MAQASLGQAAKAWKLNSNRMRSLQGALAGSPDLLKAAEEIHQLTASTHELPGPTGESNLLSAHSRGLFVSLGSTLGAVRALAGGNSVIAVNIDPELVKALAGAGAPIAAADMVRADDLSGLKGLAGVIASPDREDLRDIRVALAGRDGAIAALLAPTCSAGSLLHAARHRTQTSLSSSTRWPRAKAALLLRPRIPARWPDRTMPIDPCLNMQARSSWKTMKPYWKSRPSLPAQPRTTATAWRSSTPR